MTVRWCLTLLLWWLRTAMTSSNCPNDRCICEETYLICKDFYAPKPGENFKPTNIPQPAVDLSNITVLKGGVLPVNITEFDLTRSPILSIADDAFDQSALTLTTVSFIDTRLTSIPHAFLRLKALQFLTITDTPIKNWNEPAMLNVASTLKTLSLTNVSLTSWPSWLSQCFHLTDLDISESSISTLPDTAFDSRWVNLTSLSLTSNLIRQLPQALSTLTTIRYLNLENSKLNNLTFLPYLSPLTDLSLSGNNITNATHLGDYVKFYAKSLTTLSIQNNQLTTLPNLESLTLLTYIDLSNNRLFDPYYGPLPFSLTMVNLDNNFFQRIPPFLASLTSITSYYLASNSINQIWGMDFTPIVNYVDLRSNRISSLTASSLPETSAITNLVLDDNPLVSIEPLTFKNQAKLTTLSLRNTRLTRLPLALTDLSTLTFLDVFGSPFLKCTCQEKQLSHWVLSKPIYTLNGNCGLLGIYDFFTIYAPQCP